MEKRLETIYEDKLDRKITPQFYEKKFTEYTQTKESVLDELKNLSDRSNAYYEAGYSIHELACHARRIYERVKTSNEEKRLLLSYLFSNQSLKDGKLEVKITLACEFLQKWMPIINSTFEQLESSLDKRKKEAFASAHPVLLFTVNSIRTRFVEVGKYVYIPDLG